MTQRTDSEPTQSPRTRTAAVATVSIATAAFVVVFGWLGLNQFWRFHLHAFDLGIFTQGTWLLSRFEEPFFITTRGLPLFADHSSYILVFLAPLARLFPTAQMLIVVMALALAAIAPLAFVVARRAGAGHLLATTTAVLVLFAPAVQWNMRDSFHPEVLVVPLVVGAIALLQRDRDWWAIAVLFVALTAKEDVGLLVAPLGLIVAWVMGKRRTGFAVFALGVAAFLLNFLVLLPTWSPSGELLYSYRYAAIGDGPIDIAFGLMTRPDLWIDVATDPTRLAYVALLVGAMPLSVLAPRWLLAGVPALVANLFSGHGYQYEIEYHYTAYLIAVVVIAGAYGAAVVDRRGNREVTIGALAVCVLVAGITFGVAAPVRGWAASHEHQDQIRSMLEEVPADASISAWSTLVPSLAERDIVYVFPNPFVPFYYGTGGDYGLLGGDVPDVDAVEWIALRTDSYEEFDGVIDGLLGSGEFEVVRVDDPFILLRRR